MGEFQKKKWINATQSPTYWSWVNMVRRCYDEKHPAHSKYLERGIVVCDRWQNSFDDFFSDMGEKPAGMTLDRINNDGNYEPSNCRWATPEQQAQNRSSNTLNIDTAVQIIREIRAGATISGTARKYGYIREHIRDLFAGKIWKEAGAIASQEIN